MDFIEQSLRLAACEDYISFFKAYNIDSKNKFLSLNKAQLRHIIPNKIGITLRIWRVIEFLKGRVDTARILICPEKIKLIQEQRGKNYEELMNLQDMENELNEEPKNNGDDYINMMALMNTIGTIPNHEKFNCGICFDDIEKGDGVVLNDCLHSFCKVCLTQLVKNAVTPEIKCPFIDNNKLCDGILSEREIKDIVSSEIFERYLTLSLQFAEAQIDNTFHCRTKDCPGWCEYEFNVISFTCPVCTKSNCLTCRAIHEGQNCKEYQEELEVQSETDPNAKKTKIAINRMLKSGEALNCPKCQIIVMKKSGCDNVICSYCKTQICWITKGPRWGPKGPGDESGGCLCRSVKINRKLCHPKCGNCH